MKSRKRNDIPKRNKYTRAMWLGKQKTAKMAGARQAVIAKFLDRDKFVIFFATCWITIPEANVGITRSNSGHGSDDRIWSQYVDKESRIMPTIIDRQKFFVTGFNRKIKTGNARQANHSELIDQEG